MRSHDSIRWRVRWQLRKFRAGAAKPYMVIHRTGNLLMTAGATALFTKLTGGAGTTFSNANAYIGIGDSTDTEDVADTDLQASSNKVRKAMDATFPSISGASATWQATFGTGDANFDWNEWGIFNASSSGTMLNRKVSALGTKTSADSWELEVTTSLS